MTNLADQVQTYVSNQPWSSKKKERFMNAYSDIMSRGITGADNSTGQWMISTGGDQIEYKDKKDWTEEDINNRTVRLAEILYKRSIK